MTLEKAYGNIILREGDIADYLGNAIVIPIFPDERVFDAPGAVLNAVYRKEEFSDLGDQLEQLISAMGPNDTALVKSGIPGIDNYLLAGCFDHEIMALFGGQFPNVLYIEPTKRAAIATKNYMETAREQGFETLATPILLTGAQGGDINEILPEMVKVFKGFKESGYSPKITVYAYGETAYRDAERILNSLLG